MPISPVSVLDYGFVRLLNISGPIRRPAALFDADDIDPARTARVSFGAFEEEGRSREDDLKLIQYLLRKQHNTPIEMIETWWEMKLPIFVARQFIRHRTATVNEISARYTKLPDEWYIPTPEIVGKQAKGIKQGRAEIGDDETALEAATRFSLALNEQCQDSYYQYELAINRRIPAELARSFLHVNHYTRWVWKQDLWNLLHFLSKRLPEDAQYEARAYAKAILEILRLVLPDLIEIAEKELLGEPTR